MGYTHHWNIKAKAKDLKVKEIAQDILTLIMASEIPVCREYNRTDEPPELTETLIAFNGPNDDGAGTFVYPPDEEYLKTIGINPNSGWCKTSKRPYNIIVAAATISMKDHLGPMVQISGDGRLEDQEWQDAVNLYRRAFPGRSIPKGLRKTR